jgi:hypothetical protein
MLWGGFPALLALKPAGAFPPLQAWNIRITGGTVIRFDIIWDTINS